MSITSVGADQSQLLQQLLAQQSNTGSTQFDGLPPGPPPAPPASSTATGSTSQTGLTNFVSQFSADLNSLLLNLQSGSATSATTTDGTTGGSATSSSTTATSSTSTSANGSDSLQTDLAKVAGDLGKLSHGHGGHHHHHAAPASSDDASTTDGSTASGSNPSTNANQPAAGSLDALIKAMKAYTPTGTDSSIALVAATV